MGGSSKQVSGYKYFANFLLFIGNPIERLIAINFDKRGWEQGKRVPYGSNGEQITIDAPNMYGENEGGVSGLVYLKKGTDTQTPVEFYQEYLESVSLPALAYPFQSYLAFKDFYLGNSGYPKEMLLWPKRIHVKNDGSPQWYDEKAEIDSYKYITAPEFSLPFGTAIECNATYYFYNDSMGYSYEDGEFQAIQQGETIWSDNKIFFPNNKRIHAYRSFGYGLPDGLITLNSKTHYPPIGNFILKVEITITVANAEPIVSVDGLLGYTLKISETASSKVFVYSGFWRTINALEINTFNNGFTGSALNDYYTGATLQFNFEPVVGPAVSEVLGLDINPIHKIREILTDDTAMNKPESGVNDANFVKAADRIWGEGLGISWAITEKSCMDAINELCSHIEAGIRVNRQTGLYEMVLFRDDWFEESEIHSLAENKIKSMQIDPINVEDVKNYLNVSHYDRENIKDASFSIAENASIKNAGGFVNAETADFPYFMNQRNAAVVAQWKLKQLTTPCWKGTFTTGYSEARKWNRYDIVRINWSRKNIVDLPVRIMSINLGDGINNTVSIDFVEVVPFSDELTPTVVIVDKIDTAPLPPQACQYEPFEMPYYLAVMALGQRKVDEELSYENDFGLVGVVAEKPQNNSLYAVMMTHDGTAGEDWNRAGSINYDETADLDQIISRTSSNFTVKKWKKIANVSAGTLIKCGRDWLGTPGEWMVFQGVDPYTGVVSVKRGALDTLPQEWGVDTKLYFCGNDVAYDSTEYLSGEEIQVSALTTTPSGILEQGGSIPIEIQSRAIRPYPPANVKFNDAYYPETLVVTNDIVLIWVDRNRVQQTGGEILGFYDAGVTKETGVTYSYELISGNVVLNSGANITENTITILSSVLLQNQPHTLKLWSVRDGYASYQIFEHAFFVESASLILTATATKSQVSGNTVPAANITVNVDESLTANMQFDGSSISGKAQAGATITIEIEE